MNCDDTIKCIERFVNHDLTSREMEGFLDHVEECSACYEELEIYYTVAVTMNYLEKNVDGNYNIPLRLKEHLSQERQRLQRQKIFRYCIAVLLGILGACLIWFLFSMHIPVVQIFMQFGAQLFSVIE
ncbi:MAG TPA: hypothetical protein DF613_12685 [Lachnospiraceae bacterium]|nr:hypothetical protein [Lachnospiraceae bacterium]